MVHSYVNISITKTTTYAFYLSFLIVLLVRRNERNVGLRSLFHILLISKEPVLAFIHSCFFFPCHASLDHLQVKILLTQHVQIDTYRQMCHLYIMLAFIWFQHEFYVENPPRTRGLTWCYLNTISPSPLRFFQVEFM